jgi:hypothetical protein
MEAKDRFRITCNGSSYIARDDEDFLLFIWNDLPRLRLYDQRVRQ